MVNAVSDRCTHYVGENGYLIRQREHGFGYAVRGGARRHVSSDIESRTRFQRGGDITGYKHPLLQQVLDLLALRSCQRRPFTGDNPVLAGRRVLP